MDTPSVDTIQPASDHPAAQSVEKSVAAPPPPAEPTDPLGITGTLMHYANQYGLLAGAVLSGLLIGTIVVRRIWKRNK